jgi:hypothetical protein
MTTSAVGYFQQWSVLRQDVEEMGATAEATDKKVKKTPKSSIVKSTEAKKTEKKTSRTRAAPNKRRKR